MLVSSSKIAEDVYSCHKPFTNSIFDAKFNIDVCLTDMLK